MKLLRSLATASVLLLTACTPVADQTMVVTVYFDNEVLNPGAADCGRVYGVHRTVPASADVLGASVRELLAGPTAEESAQGYRSWFSAATADALLGTSVVGDTSYVDLADVSNTIPNASTSCGSAALLAQLGTTAQQAAMTPRVLYAFDGQPGPFWAWLQVGCTADNDHCDPAPFGGPPATPPATPTVAPSPTPTVTATDLQGVNEAFVTAFDDAAALLSVDVVRFLSGQEALDHAAGHPVYWDRLVCNGGGYEGGDTTGCSIDNDYLIVNDNPRVRTLPVTPDVDIRLIPWPECCEVEPTTRAAFAERVLEQEHPLLVSLDVAPDGSVTQVWEIYTP